MCQPCTRQDGKRQCKRNKTKIELTPSLQGQRPVSQPGCWPPAGHIGTEPLTDVRSPGLARGGPPNTAAHETRSGSILSEDAERSSLSLGNKVRRGPRPRQLPPCPRPVPRLARVTPECQDPFKSTAHGSLQSCRTTAGGGGVQCLKGGPRDTGSNR